MLYSGTDGRMLEVEIFEGIIYYQRLRHMTADKWQVRMISCYFWLGCHTKESSQADRLKATVIIIEAALDCQGGWQRPQNCGLHFTPMWQLWLPLVWWFVGFQSVGQTDSFGVTDPWDKFTSHCIILIDIAVSLLQSGTFLKGVVQLSSQLNPPAVLN